MIGFFAKLTLKKDYETGRVTLCDAAVLPTLTLRRNVPTRPRFAVVPAYADPDRITGLDTPLTEGEIGSLLNARAFALGKIEGIEGLRVLDETDE